ncbi:glycosyltransferase family 2 protein [Muribacter muris]|uniref:Glycosyltransferase family 2 protein n=1 Tax=Muribacter muris TaxID=67855 RepID=A0A4Y9JV78_9PAST|nr:glycosyltransferase family 2 protein [Muribacter muris]MBF0785302.1 glycosyltransferase family 2 protein [Muribacter muris]MBF0826316.1 glycosyltransferase family 2 protein [Muribacter muris]TFV09703.1 glycosyltransferase family 2 protein [Muribacter muris]
MFSIIVPSYNRKEEIPYLLESLLHQTVYNFEVIIIDDFSEVPVDIHHFYPFPVNIIRNSENKGAAESRNIGVRYAKNDWLLFLDDDDRFLVDKCELLEKTIQSYPEINFIYHPAECMMINEHFSYFTRPFKNEKEITLEGILKANKVGGMPMIAIKKVFFEKLKGLSSDLLSLEDYEFVLKAISDEEFNPKYIDKALTKCAFHTQRASVSTNTANTERAIELIRQKYVKTAEQAKYFEFNSLYMLAYPHIMNLSRRAARFYLKMGWQSKKIKYFIIAFITFISPKLAINLKRFI